MFIDFIQFVTNSCADTLHTALMRVFITPYGFHTLHGNVYTFSVCVYVFNSLCIVLCRLRTGGMQVYTRFAYVEIFSDNEYRL